MNGAVKKKFGHSTRESKSNNLEPHSPTTTTKSRSLKDTKTSVALPHCGESTRDSIAGWWTFWLKVTPELWRSYGTSYVRKKNGGRGVSSRVFVGKIGFSDFFYKKLKSVSCEYDRLNGWNSTLQAALYIRRVRWTCLFYILFVIWFLWAKPTTWLLIPGMQFHKKIRSRVFYVFSVWKM